MPEICIIPPSGEPLHIDEAKLDRRVIDTSDDGRIRSLIGAARQYAEMITRRQLLHARWQLTLDCFPMAFSGSPLPFRNSVNIPANAVILPHAPLVDVVSIQYVDMSGVTQTMPATDYAVNKANEPALITPCFGKVWPICLPQIGSVIITYDAGYASPIAVPAPGAQFTVNSPVTWSVGNRVQFYNSGDSTGKLPSPLSVDSAYLIASAPGNNVYTLTDALGAAINFTDVGVGRSFIGVVPDGIRNWMLLRVGSLYENREEAAIVQKGGVKELPWVDGLLDPFRISMP